MCSPVGASRSGAGTLLEAVCAGLVNVRFTIANIYRVKRPENRVVRLTVLTTAGCRGLGGLLRNIWGWGPFGLP